MQRRYLVTVETSTPEAADRVMAERLDSYEDYGFFYTIDWQETPKNTLAQLAERQQYVARFSPQAWIKGNAVEVDPEGDTEWDCTNAFHALPAEYGESLIGAMDTDGEALDDCDLLHSDPLAPEWVQDWHGPFDLYVRRSEVHTRDLWVSPVPDPNGHASEITDLG